MRQILNDTLPRRPSHSASFFETRLQKDWKRFVSVGWRWKTASLWIREIATRHCHHLSICSLSQTALIRDTRLQMIYSICRLIRWVKFYATKNHVWNVFCLLIVVEKIQRQKQFCFCLNHAYCHVMSLLVLCCSLSCYVFIFVYFCLFIDCLFLAK